MFGERIPACGAVVGAKFGKLGDIGFELQIPALFTLLGVKKSAIKSAKDVSRTGAIVQSVNKVVECLFSCVVFVLDHARVFSSLVTQFTQAA